MWELIRANRRRSWFIFFGLGVILIALGSAIGGAAAGTDGMIIGAGGAVGCWIVLAVIAYFQGAAVLLSASGAREISAELYPQLFNVVEEMKIAAALETMPRIYLINDSAPNAFAAGTRPGNWAIAVTTGLVLMMDRDQLQGVIAHEVSHIANRDVQFVTFAGVMLGSIVMLADMFVRGMRYSSYGRIDRYRSRRSSVGGQGAAIFLAVALVLSILAPLLARLLYFALSRSREYLADASAVRLTRYPEGLASALEKIAGGRTPLKAANRVTAPMYIVNPFLTEGLTAGLFSTHPPTYERIRVLRALQGDVALGRYRAALTEVAPGARVLFPSSVLRDTRRISIRDPFTEDKSGDEQQPSARQVGDLLRAIGQYRFLACACGLKMKVPPEYDEPVLHCPRCGRENVLPHALYTTGQSGKDTAQTAPATPRRATYARKTNGSWETFSCACGRPLQLSPLFMGTTLTCRQCGCEVAITPSEESTASAKR